LKQIVSGKYVGLGSRAGEKLFLVDSCLDNELFRLVPAGNNLFTIVNRNGLFFARKGEQDLEFSTTKDRWEFYPVNLENSLANKLTNRLVERVFGDRLPTFLKQLKSSMVNFRSDPDTAQQYPSDLPPRQ